MDGRTGILLWGKNALEKLEIASLTKVMTAFTAIRVFHLLKMDFSSISFIVSPKCTQAIGTSAGLIAYDKLKVADLFYGLLLPSGNDAAICLAEGCGELIINGWGKGKYFKNKIRKSLGFGLIKQISDMNPIEVFIKYMNRLSHKFGLLKSSFTNPNGLADRGNKSTAADVGNFAHLAKKNPYIAKVVRTAQYKCIGITGMGEKRIYNWVNTNILLNEGYDGLKTGITPTAGPCLIASKKYRGVPLIITLLHSKSCDHRWKETREIYDWAINVIDNVDKYDLIPESKKLAMVFHKVI